MANSESSKETSDMSDDRGAARSRPKNASAPPPNISAAPPHVTNAPHPDLAPQMQEKRPPKAASKFYVGRLLAGVAKLLVGLGVLGLLSCLATVLVATEYFASRGLAAVADKKADVIIVLSAGLEREAALDPFSRARVEAGVRLWQAGVAPKLLMSGGYDERVGQHLAESMKLYAVSIGAPESVIYVEGLSISTFENARFTLDVAAQEDWARAVVVSDDYHLLRAWGLFEFWRKTEDIEIIGLAAAAGRAQVSVGRQLLVLGRETLAYPFNILKIAGQIGLELLGRGKERMIR